MDKPPDDAAAPARLRDLPSWLLTQTAVHASRLVADGLATAGARGYHYRLLATLEEFGAASQATLGRRSGVHFSDVVAAVNELAERGFVERAPDPGDRRRNIISITPAGREQLHRLDDALARTQDTLLAPLTPDQRRELAALLTTLLDHHTRRVRDAVPPAP